METGGSGPSAPGPGRPAENRPVRPDDDPAGKDLRLREPSTLPHEGPRGPAVCALPPHKGDKNDNTLHRRA